MFAHFYYGKFIRHTPISDFQVTAYHASEDISLRDIEQYPSFATIGSYQNIDRLDDFDEAWMLVSANEKKTYYIFAHVRRSTVKERGWYYLDYHHVILPIDIARQHFKKLGTLAILTQEDDIAKLYNRISPEEQEIQSYITPRQIPAIDGAVLQEYKEACGRSTRIDLIKRLKELFADPDIPVYVISVLLSGEKLCIFGLDNGQVMPHSERILLLHSILAFVPDTYGKIITSSSVSFDPVRCPAQLQLMYMVPIPRGDAKFHHFHFQSKKCQERDIEFSLHGWQDYVEELRLNWGESAEHINKIIENAFSTEDEVSLFGYLFRKFSQGQYKEIGRLLSRQETWKINKFWQQYFKREVLSINDLFEHMTFVLRTVSFAEASKLNSIEDLMLAHSNRTNNYEYDKLLAYTAAFGDPENLINLLRHRRLSFTDRETLENNGEKPVWRMSLDLLSLEKDDTSYPLWFDARSADEIDIVVYLAYLVNEANYLRNDRTYSRYKSPFRPGISEQLIAIWDRFVNTEKFYYISTLKEIYFQTRSIHEELANDDEMFGMLSKRVEAKVPDLEPI